jgi:hypothetical protein
MQNLRKNEMARLRIIMEEGVEKELRKQKEHHIKEN